MSGPLDRARLELTADVDGDGQDEDGVFEMAGNLMVRPRVRTGFLLNGRGSTVNSIISSSLDDGKLSFLDGPERTSKRRGFYLDLGGGQMTWDIEFRGWDGARDADGVPLQWGNDAEPGRTMASATGQGPQTQMDVLMRYIASGTADSRDPAILEVGEYSEAGLYEPQQVALEGPAATRRSETSDGYDGTMTCIAVADLDTPWDAAYRDDR